MISQNTAFKETHEPRIQPGLPPRHPPLQNYDSQGRQTDREDKLIQLLALLHLVGQAFYINEERTDAAKYHRCDLCNEKRCATCDFQSLEFLISVASRRGESTPAMRMLWYERRLLMTGTAVTR